MDSDATVAMSKILEERRKCSAFEEKALMGLVAAAAHPQDWVKK